MKNNELRIRNADVIVLLIVLFLFVFLGSYLFAFWTTGSTTGSGHTLQHFRFQMLGFPALCLIYKLNGARYVQNMPYFGVPGNRLW